MTITNYEFVELLSRYGYSNEEILDTLEYVGKMVNGEALKKAYTEFFSNMEAEDAS